MKNIKAVVFIALLCIFLASCTTEPPAFSEKPGETTVDGESTNNVNNEQGETSVTTACHGSCENTDEPQGTKSPSSSSVSTTGGAEQNKPDNTQKPNQTTSDNDSGEVIVPGHTDNIPDTREPEGETQAPGATTTERPGSATTQRPAVTTQRPAVTTQRPAVTTQRPAVTTAPSTTTPSPGTNPSGGLKVEEDTDDRNWGNVYLPE